jgi:hypothetical protein
MLAACGRPTDLNIVGKCRRSSELPARGSKLCFPLLIASVLPPKTAIHSPIGRGSHHAFVLRGSEFSLRPCQSYLHCGNDPNPVHDCDRSQTLPYARPVFSDKSITNDSTMTYQHAPETYFGDMRFGMIAALQNAPSGRSVAILNVRPAHEETKTALQTPPTSSSHRLRWHKPSLDVIISPLLGQADSKHVQALSPLCSRLWAVAIVETAAKQRKSYSIPCIRIYKCIYTNINREGWSKHHR